jgi:hypothetical protein
VGGATLARDERRKEEGWVSSFKSVELCAERKDGKGGRGGGGGGI